MRAATILVTLWFSAATALPALLHERYAVTNGPALQTIVLPLPDGWQIKPGSLTVMQDMLKEATARRYNDTLLLDITDPDGRAWEVQIFFCNSRRPHNRLSVTVDRVNCLHGHYQTLTLQPVEIASAFRASRLHMSRRSEFATALFWLQSPKQTSALPFPHMAHLYWQEFLQQRTDGCFVKIATVDHVTLHETPALGVLAYTVHSALANWLQQRSAQLHSPGGTHPHPPRTPCGPACALPQNIKHREGNGGR